MPNSGLQNPITGVKTTIPAPNTLAGYTATTGVAGTVVQVSGAPVDAIYGTAVRLLTRNGDIKMGDYIYDAAQGQMRKITSISYANDSFGIESAFTAPLAAIALVIIPRSDMEEISFLSITGTTVVTDAFGNTSDIVEGQSVEWNKPGKNHAENGFVGPFIIDTVTNGSTLSFQFKK